MNELELLERLQNIKTKLDNNEELTDNEYKIFTSMLFVTAMDIIKKSLNYMLSLFGDKND